MLKVTIYLIFERLLFVKIITNIWPDSEFYKMACRSILDFKLTIGSK